MTRVRDLPRAGLSLTRNVVGDALANAGAAADYLSDQVAQRRALAPQEDPGPGGLSQLGREECLRLLRTRSVARLAYVARAGRPDIVPVNYALLDGDVLIRSGPGPKLQAAERREWVALEVDDIDDAGRTGWSVVVVGRARRLTAAEQAAIAPDALPVTWADGPRTALIRIRVERLDGRRLH